MDQEAARVHIRPITASDAEALRALHATVSDRSRYLRFFGSGRSQDERYVSLLLRPASRHHQAFGAWIDGRLVGVAAFDRLTDFSADVALLVADDHHEEGIGSMLSRHIAEAATRSGIRRLEADVLGDNELALRMVRDLSRTARVRYEAGVARVIVDIAPEAPAAV